MSSHSHKSQNFSPLPTTSRPPRALNALSSNITSTGNNSQQGSTTEQQARASRHPPFQITDSRLQQGHPTQFHDSPSTKVTSQSHGHPLHFASNTPTTSHHLVQGSRSTENYSWQTHNTRLNTQINEQPSVAEPPTRSVSMTLNQSVSTQAVDSDLPKKYNTNYTNSNTRGPPISATHGNASSMTLQQSPQISRGTESRFQQPGPASSTAQPYQPPISESPVRTSLLSTSQFIVAARHTDNDPHQVQDLTAQSHNHPHFPGPHSMAHQFSPPSSGTGNRPQPTYETDPRRATRHQHSASEQLFHNSSISSSQIVPSRGADRYQQLYDVNTAGLSSGQSAYNPHVSISHDKTSPTMSYSSPQAHASTDDRSQQHHSIGPPTDSPSDELPGRDLTGDIEILLCPDKEYKWKIGTGAFTDVYKGKFRNANVSPEFVAVKVFRASTEEKREDTEATSRRLIRESTVWLRLRHPNIQPYLGHCSNLDLAVALISPLCKHGNVKKYIGEHPSANKMRLLKDVSEGIRYLHSEDVIHGDLHPKNILVDDNERARLTDFGRAKIIGERGFSTNLLAGCVPYMAPELFPTTEDEVDVNALFSKSSDVYAFGIICFEILTDKAPFASYRVGSLAWLVMNLILSGKRPRLTSEAQNLIPPYMWEIMQACWPARPEERISAEDLVRHMRSP